MRNPMRQPDRQSTQWPEQLDVQRSEQLDTQRPERLDVQQSEMPEQPDTQQSEKLGAQQSLHHITTHTGEGRCAVTLEATVAPSGGGLTCYLYGGEAPHVGGMALAAPGPTLDGRQLSRADVWDATVPGHKDAEAARSVARRLAIACQQPVSVTVGIHVEDATQDDLAEIGRNIDACVDELLAQAGIAAGHAPSQPEGRDTTDPAT